MANSAKFNSEVDQISITGDATEDVEETDEQLNVEEERLLILIKDKRIDVKANYADKYKDVNCHFCRSVLMYFSLV